MLTILVPETELYDEQKNEFIQIKEQTLVLEHSLVSIAKWESKWKKSYLSTKNKTYEETIDYIKCMTITKNVNPLIYRSLNREALESINRYINDPMTATYFSERDERPSGPSIITAEIVYYWMISLNVPMECQKWHFNRLIALIKVCNIKNNPGRKMSRREILTRNQALNEERKRKYNTRG
jgi:hypothetical protein